MKKTIFALFALLAVFACSKKEMDIQTPEQERDNTPMSFNLSVNPMNGEAETKADALRADWSNGDVVYVFFDAIPTKYIKKSYDGSTWTNSFPGGDFVAGDFSADDPAASRYMTAVWFPKEMGTVTVTYADSKFSFTIGGEKIYSHYMSVHAGYTVDGTTISGTLDMEKPSGFVQFFVPGTAAPIYRLMESHLTPKACDYVALAGGVSLDARTPGYSIKGMAFTSDASVSGSLFGGYLETAGTETDYEFTLVKEISVEKPAAVGTYTLSGTRTIDEGTSLTFPIISNTADWGDLSPFASMGFGDILWATGNLKETSPYIADPLVAGDYYKWGYTTPYDVAGTTDPHDSYKADADFVDTATAKNDDWSLPTKVQFDALIDASNTETVWKTDWTNIGTTKGGRLITSKVNGISLFFAAAGFYSDGLLCEAGDNGCYWSSSPHDDLAYNLDFVNGKIETYYFNRTLGFSVRPVKAASAHGFQLLSTATSSDVGKVVCSNGHLHEAKTAVPAGCIAVGVLGKVSSTGHGLILALKDATSQTWNTINGWSSASYAGTSLKVLPDDAARGSLTSYTILGTTPVSNWAVADMFDYNSIFYNLHSTIDDGYGYTYDDNVNSYITTGVGGDALSNDTWSTSQGAGGGIYAPAYSFHSGGWSPSDKSYTKSIRPVLGF